MQCRPCLLWRDQVQKIYWGTSKNIVKIILKRFLGLFLKINISKNNLGLFENESLNINKNLKNCI